MTKKQRSLFRSFNASILTVALVATLSAIPYGAAAALNELDARSEGRVEYVSNADGSLTVNFAAQSLNAPPRFTRAALAADENVDGSPFRGDYIARGVAYLSFQVQADATPGSARLVLFGADSGRIWWRNVDIAPTGDGSMSVSVPLSVNDMWDRNSGTAANWAADLADVDVIGLEIQQGGRDAQSYTIAGFVIRDRSGAAIAGEAELSPLERDLLDAFGVATVNALSIQQRLLDSSGDGMADWERILAEHDDAFYLDIFSVRKIVAADDGVQIRWPAVKGSVYDVHRAPIASIADPNAYQPVSKGVGLVAAATHNMPFVDETAQKVGDYIYRVIRVQKNSAMGE